MLLKLEGFQYAKSLDLNMVYCNIQLSINASNLCTYMLPQVKYFYKNLPIGVDNSTDISNIKWMIYFMDFNSSVRT